MNIHPIDDTITAISTPPGIGAIAVIRVSGKDAINVVNSIFVGKIDLKNSRSHTVHYGKIVDKTGELIDDVLITVFKGPNSYTGEDTVEISTHGNPVICTKVIQLLVDKKVRLAEPGEFTKRAYLNGRIDLAQAEAVMDIINSRTDASLRGARNQLDGLLSNKIKQIRESLINSSSFVELELDFSEEDVEFVNRDYLSQKLNEIISEIDTLLETYKFGKIIKDGVNVALVGKPNVGKSSILNYILKESRAIVSPIPGTTRDVIREDVSINGVLFRLFDTAGIRLSSDEIEKEGVLRSRNSIRTADLILFINDVDQEFDKNLYNEIIELNHEQKIIKVLNKIDLAEINSSGYDVKISAKTGEGIEQLLNLLEQKALGAANYTEKSAIVSNIRHYNCLKEAKISLHNAMDSIAKKMSGEFIAVDLRNAENQLGEIIGTISSDDILNNIFQKFCIGK